MYKYSYSKIVGVETSTFEFGGDRHNSTHHRKVLWSCPPRGGGVWAEPGIPGEAEWMGGSSAFRQRSTTGERSIGDGSRPNALFGKVSSNIMTRGSPSRDDHSYSWSHVFPLPAPKWSRSDHLEPRPLIIHVLLWVYFTLGDSVSHKWRVVVVAVLFFKI